MGTKNAYLDKLRADKARELERMRVFTIQWCADAAVLAANDVFKRKGDVIAEFCKKMQEYADEIARVTLEDAKGDKNIEYTISRVDERLEDVLGEHFRPWEERYNQ